MKLHPGRFFASRGDEERVLERFAPYQQRPVCGPASWTAPTIGGDGTVYASAMDGILYAIRDVNSDGVIDETEVSTLDIGAAALHPGAAFAPGMMAFASCQGLNVFEF